MSAPSPMTKMCKILLAFLASSPNMLKDMSGLQGLKVMVDKSQLLHHKTPIIDDTCCCCKWVCSNKSTSGSVKSGKESLTTYAGLGNGKSGKGSRQKCSWNCNGKISVHTTLGNVLDRCNATHPALNCDSEIVVKFLYCNPSGGDMVAIVTYNKNFNQSPLKHWC